MNHETTTLVDKLEELEALDSELAGIDEKVQRRDELRREIEKIPVWDLLQAERNRKPKTNGSAGKKITRPRMQAGEPEPGIVAKWKEAFKGKKVLEVSTEDMKLRAVEWKTTPEVVLGSLKEVATKEGVTKKWTLNK